MISKFNKDTKNKTNVDKYKHVDKSKVDKEKLCDTLKKKKLNERVEK